MNTTSEAIGLPNVAVAIIHCCCVGGGVLGGGVVDGGVPGPP